MSTFRVVDAELSLVGDLQKLGYVLVITFESFTVQLVLERTEGKNKDVEIGIVRRS